MAKVTLPLTNFFPGNVYDNGNRSASVVVIDDGHKRGDLLSLLKINHKPIKNVIILYL